MLLKYIESAEFKRRYSSSNRTRDVSPVLLPELQESGGIPDHSSAFQYDGENDDDDVTTEAGDSREEVY